VTAPGPTSRSGRPGPGRQEVGALPPG
jgi:hypothetical protein